MSSSRKRGLGLVPPDILATRPDFGIEVYRGRLQHGWTQQVLADRAGLTQPEVSDIETGKLSLGPTRLARLAKALGWTD